MKVVLKPAKKEDALFYSDFKGKVFEHNIPPFVIQICCNYGSSFDGEYSELHLTEEEGKQLLGMIKGKLTKESLEKNKHIFDRIDG